MGSGSGSGSGSSSADEDGDGVLDDADNCVVAGNADQRNHDLDSLGDACDLCPHVIDAGRDTDFDGVGDACDPRPADAGDRIAFFEGFYVNVAWDPAVGTTPWQPIMGTLRQPSLSAAHTLVRDDTPDLGQVFVDALVRIDAVSTNNAARRSAGVVLAFQDPNHYIFCGIATGTVPQTAEVNAGQVTTDFFGNPHYDYAPGTFPAQMSGSWLRLQAQTSPADFGNTRIDCVTHRPGATGSATFVGDAEITGDVGIRTNGADASFDYVFVVAVGT